MKSPKRTIATLTVVAAAAFPLGTATAGAAEAAPSSVAYTSPMAAAFSSAVHQTKAPVHSDCDDPSCDMSDVFAAAYQQSGGTQDAIAAAAYGAQGGPGTVTQSSMAGLAGGAAGGAVNGMMTGGDFASMMAGAAAGGLAGMAAGAATQAAKNAAAGSVEPESATDETAFD